MSLLITNIEHGWVGDKAGNRLHGALRIEGNRIAEIGDLSPRPNEDTLDASGLVVTPGLVNTHHHLFQSVLKGVPSGINAPLDEWLGLVPYTYWPDIDEETLRVSARIGLAELALSGATTVCDHHYVFSDRYDYDPVDVLCEEAARFGVRFCMARGGMTRGRRFDGPGIPPPPTETITGYLDGVAAAAGKWHDPAQDSMCTIASAPTTPNFNFSPEELTLIAQEARHLGLRRHAHLSENTSYAAMTLAQYGKRPVHWLAELDWLGDDVWFAHLVDLHTDEIALLAETSSAMAHCPQANARLASGIAPAPDLQALGGCVSLGVDGAAANEAADMGAALYAAFTLHRTRGDAQSTSVAQVIHWATKGGAAALGYKKLGTLDVGQIADIALFDLSAPRNFGLHDPAFAPVITGQANAKHTIVNGVHLIKDGLHPHLDLRQLHDDARRVTTRMNRTRHLETA